MDAEAASTGPESPRSSRAAEPAGLRRAGVLGAARARGLIGGAKDKAIAARVPTALVQAAKARSGIASDSELLLYALSKVALEDEFGRKLLARKGRVARDVALDT